MSSRLGHAEIEAALRASFEEALPSLVRATAQRLGAEPRPLTERDRSRARAALRRAGLLPDPSSYVRLPKEASTAG